MRFLLRIDHRERVETDAPGDLFRRGGVGVGATNNRRFPFRTDAGGIDCWPGKPGWSRSLRDASGLAVLAGPQRRQKGVARKHGQVADSSRAGLQAHAQVALEPLFFREGAQRLEILS